MCRGQFAIWPELEQIQVCICNFIANCRVACGLGGQLSCNARSSATNARTDETNARRPVQPMQQTTKHMQEPKKPMTCHRTQECHMSHIGPWPGQFPGKAWSPRMPHGARCMAHGRDVWPMGMFYDPWHVLCPITCRSSD